MIFLRAQCQWFILILLGSFIFVPDDIHAQPVDCAALSKLDCVVSTQCMLTQTNLQNPISCVAPKNRCEIGFQQAILSENGWTINRAMHQKTIDQCQSRPGCKYEPAGQCFCPPDVNCICGGGPPPSCLQSDVGELPPPMGTYTIVGARSVSGVATTSPNFTLDEVLGKEIILAKDALHLDGLACDSWQIRAITSPVNETDPLIGDVVIGPLEPSVTDGDKRILAGWEYVCEGESFLKLLQVDPRVIVIPWANGTIHLIAEQQLAQSQIHRLQLALIDVKFLDQAPTDVLDKATLLAISSWAEYRMSAQEPYRFKRAAITENLFDTMNVFNVE